MYFKIFLSKYKSQIYSSIFFSAILFKEFPKYRKIITLLYLLILGVTLIISFLYWIFKNFNFQIFFNVFVIEVFIFIALILFFDSRKKNNEEWNKIRLKAYKRNLELLINLLKETRNFEKNKINYIKNEAIKYKTKNKIENLIKTPTIISTIFLLFFLPKIQNIIEKRISDEIFLKIIYVFVVISGTLYLLYYLAIIFYISNSEVCDKLIDDLEYIINFKLSDKELSYN